jgi:hypothetical protein
MNKTQVRKCSKCGVQISGYYGDLCKRHYHEDMTAYMLLLPEEDRDWEFAVCEACGSHLWNDGECHNTSCGNSPFQGEDWD